MNYVHLFFALARTIFLLLMRSI